MTASGGDLSFQPIWWPQGNRTYADAKNQRKGADRVLSLRLAEGVFNVLRFVRCCQFFNRKACVTVNG